MKSIIIAGVIYSYGCNIYTLIKLLKKIILFCETSYNTYKYLTFCKCGVCEYNRNNNIKPIH